MLNEHRQTWGRKRGQTPDVVRTAPAKRTRSAPAGQRNDENGPSNEVNGGSETEPAVSPLA